MFRRQATADQRRAALRAVLTLAPTASSSTSSVGARNGADDIMTKAPLQDTCLTSPEQLCELLARNKEELGAFRQMDTAILKPRREIGASAEAQDVAALLMRCGRLLEPKDVPLGFEV